MKSFIAPFLISLLSLPIFSQVAKDPQLFWEVKSPKGSVSYIYGTFHSNDRKLFNLPDSLYTVIQKTGLMVVEVDMHSITRDLEVRTSAIGLNFDTHGKAYTGNSTASETIYGNEDGMPHFLDMYLLNLAQLNGIPFTTLEPMETQMQLSRGVPGLDQQDSVYLDAVLLESTLEGLYVNGDIQGIDRILRKYYSQGLYNKSIVERNNAMVERFDTLLNKQNAVVLIGAAHLGGQFGILKQLREKGWKVRAVSPVVSDNHPDKMALRSVRSLEVNDEVFAFHSTWPGVPNEQAREGLLNYYYYKELGQGNSYSIELIDKANYAELIDVAKDYILTPGDAKIIRYVTDDGYVYYEGVTDSYPEGLAWVRVIAGEQAYAVIKAYGGNKFMNSDRPQKFFNNCWFIQ